jgi:2-keto-3-deoxy-L-rhamnonate aldolase RhmA
MVNFPPLGTRSVSTANAAAEFGSRSVPEYIAQGNSSVVLIGQLENKVLETPLEDLIADLDVAFIGPVDLAVDLGYAGQPEAPAVRALVEMIEGAARAVNVPLGGFAASVEEAQDLLIRGCRYIAMGGDISLLTRAARLAVQQLRDAQSGNAKEVRDT